MVFIPESTACSADNVATTVTDANAFLIAPGGVSDTGAVTAPVVHAIPRFVVDKYCSGNWKAVTANTMAVSAHGRDVCTVLVDDDSVSTLAPRITESVRHIVMEYSLWPELIERIHRQFPRVQIHVRTHNAEALQYWHRSNPRLTGGYESIRSVYGFLRLLCRDSKCRRLSTHLLGISPWDDVNYWSRLPGKARIRYLPYFSPWPYIHENIRPKPWTQRRREIICMPGALGRWGIDMIRRFGMLAKQSDARKQTRPWSFYLTCDDDKYGDVDVPPGLKIMRGVKEPWIPLTEVMGVAVLTPFGFGMKTTIIDAMAGGCWVLVHPGLARRLPEDLKNYCIICDPDDPISVADALSKLEIEPSADNVNDQLRQGVVNTFSEVLT